MKSYGIYHLLDRYIGIPVLLVLAVLSRLRTRRPEGERTFDRILAVKLAMMGDTVLLSPVLRAVRGRFPTSRFVMLCSPLNRGVVEDWDFVDEYIVFDFGRYLRHPLEFLKFLRDLRRRHFDVALDFETWPRLTPIIEFIAGARVRAGFRVPGQLRHHLFTHPVWHRREQHEFQCFKDLVAQVGVDIGSALPSFPVDAAASARINALLERSGVPVGSPFAVIHPGCGPHGDFRRWQEEKFARVADHIVEKYGMPVVITGSAGEEGIVRNIFSAMRRTAVDLTAKTTLKELAALLARSRFLVCVNTGVVHLAAACGTKAVVLHGPTDPRRWGPLGAGHSIVRKDLPCSPCLYLGFEFRCGVSKCTRLISAEEVMDAVDAMMGKATA